MLLSSAEAGTYTFEDNAGDSELTLGNGTVTQTINIAMKLDSGAVATGATVVANFDRLGFRFRSLVSVHLMLRELLGGDLNSQSIVIEEGTGGVFQVGPTDRAVNRIEVGFKISVQLVIHSTSMRLLWGRRKCPTGSFAD